MKSKTLLLATVLTAAASAALASIQTDYDHAIDFSQYRTYTWGQIKTKDSLWADRIKQSIDQQLQAKGWRQAASDSDVVVVAFGDSHTQQEEETSYSGGGWRWGGGIATTSTYTTKQGVLVVSIFDSKSKKVAWRGTASGGLSGKPDKNIGKLNDAVSKMFKNFPPRK